MNSKNRFYSGNDHPDRLRQFAIQSTDRFRSDDGVEENDPDKELRGLDETILWIYIYLGQIRYWLQMYLFCLISLLHIIAIYAPGHYRNFNGPRTAIFVAVPCVCTIIHDTLYTTLCNCLYYQVPGYYMAIRQEKADVENKFEIFDAWLKVTMIVLLVGTDLAIIAKLYKMRSTNQKNRPTMSMSRPAQSMASPSAIVIFEATSVKTFEKRKVEKKPLTRRLEINVDTRLALAFTYVSAETILMTFFFKFLGLIPYSILPYTILLMNTLELAKCTAYVLIVTQK
ncbi:unnamed protein product, partial [Mesorhabditis belari]|uniref:7TM GPCR serpentine receptor class x (Srx) domain-containing protein n=1 Tax=Mesorhabditis belari TaxID=2138241 RepID=A0AAF3EQ41_9BILA